MSVESWYWWFEVSSVIVIIGAILEESPLPLKFVKLIGFARENGFIKTIDLLRANWLKVVETLVLLFW